MEKLIIMANYYREYYGQRFSLTAGNCYRYPNGMGKEKHAPAL